MAILCIHKLSCIKTNASSFTGARQCRCCQCVVNNPNCASSPCIHSLLLHQVTGIISFLLDGATHCSSIRVLLTSSAPAFSFHWASPSWAVKLFIAATFSRHPSSYWSLPARSVHLYSIQPPILNPTFSLGLRWKYQIICQSSRPPEIFTFPH